MSSKTETSGLRLKSLSTDKYIHSICLSSQISRQIEDFSPKFFLLTLHCTVSTVRPQFIDKTAHELFIGQCIIYQATNLTTPTNDLACDVAYCILSPSGASSAHELFMSWLSHSIVTVVNNELSMMMLSQWSLAYSDQGGEVR